MHKSCGSRRHCDCRCIPASRQAAPFTGLSLTYGFRSSCQSHCDGCCTVLFVSVESKSVRFLCFDLSNLSHPVLFALLSGGGQMHWPITAPRAAAKADYHHLLMDAAADGLAHVIISVDAVAS